MSPSPLGPDEVYYPDSDGQPLADNDWQFTAILGAVDALRVHFSERPDVYVFGDMFIYYVEGDPEQSVAPDVCVSFGVPKHKRMVYKLWEEGKAPDFVMEVASPRTWRDDLGRKRACTSGLASGSTGASIPGASSSSRRCRHCLSTMAAIVPLPNGCATV